MSQSARWQDLLPGFHKKPVSVRKGVKVPM